MKVGFISLGCSKNQVNCEQMLWQTYEAGHDIALEAEGCDIAVVNTCGFLQEAKREALEEISRLARMKEEGRLGKIIVSGCMAQRYKDELKALCPAADGFIGVGGYETIAQVLEDTAAGKKPHCFGSIHASVPETNRVILGSECSAYLRIAEGCDNRCTYCVIPFIRGNFRSRPMEAVLQEAKSLAADGIKELVIVAQDITRYGLDLYGERSLVELVKSLCKIEEIHWIRLLYLYPEEVTDELIDLIAEEPKIVKYLDIPIQHISTSVLERMNRRGTGEDIRRLFRKIRERIPGVVLRTSLICGFPGETEEDFEELALFLREFRLERAGIFAFSPEHGSAAFEMDDQVEDDVKRRRQALLTEIQMEVLDTWCENQVGKETEILCEGYLEEENLFIGRSGREAPDIDGLVYIRSEQPLTPGEFYRATITDIQDGELIVIVEEAAHEHSK